MSASLVGSEMCIRDRSLSAWLGARAAAAAADAPSGPDWDTVAVAWLMELAGIVERLGTSPAEARVSLGAVGLSEAWRRAPVG
eukprot:11942917-Alexandrium_andersonii.AAC.1